MKRVLPVVAAVFVVLPAVSGLVSGELLFQLLGGLGLLVAAGAMLSSYPAADWIGRLLHRMGDSPVSREGDAEDKGYPAETIGEQALPLVFIIAVVVIIVTAALYTGRSIGLW